VSFLRHFLDNKLWKNIPFRQFLVLGRKKNQLVEVIGFGLFRPLAFAKSVLSEEFGQNFRFFKGFNTIERKVREC
jgi:hypothetical protein